MNVYIGIDPSENSTGICLSDDNGVEKFVIIKPDKLTKREIQLSSKLDNFEYMLYNKRKINKDEINHQQEYIKTLNIIDVAKHINNVIDTYVSQFDNANVYIVQEGISYGSTLRTKSVFDLAGLNYVIRTMLIEKYVMYVCPPSEIKKFATGKGNAKKDLIVSLFNAIHSEIVLPKVDDIADAYFMMQYARILSNEQHNV